MYVIIITSTKLVPQADAVLHRTVFFRNLLHLTLSGGHCRVSRSMKSHRCTDLGWFLRAISSKMWKRWYEQNKSWQLVILETKT